MVDILEQTVLSPISEYALFMYRVFVEIRYFGIAGYTCQKSYGLEDNQIDYIDSIPFHFSEEDSKPNKKNLKR